MSDVFYPALHGRQHCPGGEDPIPCLTSELPWARRSKGFDAANQTIANNTITTLTWNHDYNIAAGESGEDYFSAVGDGIHIIQAGVYAVTAQVYWAAVVTWNWAFQITGDVAGWPPTAGQYFDATGGTINMGLISFVHMYPAGWDLAASIYQRSGSPRDVDSAYLEIVRLGSYSGTNFEDMNPNS